MGTRPGAGAVPFETDARARAVHQAAGGFSLTGRALEAFTRSTTRAHAGNTFPFAPLLAGRRDGFGGAC